MPGANAATRSTPPRSLKRPIVKRVPISPENVFFRMSPFPRMRVRVGSRPTSYGWFAPVTSHQSPDLKPRQHDPALRLVLSLLVLVAHFTFFIGFEEDHLAQPFIRVNLRGQWRCIADLQRHKAFPLRFERGHIHDDSASRIG